VSKGKQITGWLSGQDLQMLSNSGIQPVTNIIGGSFARKFLKGGGESIPVVKTTFCYQLFQVYPAWFFAFDQVFTIFYAKLVQVIGKMHAQAFVQKCRQLV
jgi:hypothetical protein